MSQENVAVVRRAFAAWDTGDFDAVPQILRRTSCGICLALTTGLNGTPTPAAELRVFWDLWLGVWVDHHLELLELFANGDKVFCRYRQTATGKASGASVEVENGQVITFRDGKVIRTDVYSDPAEAAQAAGVRL